jgi:hypothetical protein
MVLEVSDHRLLALLLWACAKAVHHSGEAMVEHNCPPMEARKQRRERLKEGTGDPISPSRAHPQSPNFLPLGPISQRFHYFLIVPQLQNNPVTHGSFGDI